MRYFGFYVDAIWRIEPGYFSALFSSLFFVAVVVIVVAVFISVVAFNTVVAFISAVVFYSAVVFSL